MEVSDEGNGAERHRPVVGLEVGSGGSVTGTVVNGSGVVIKDGELLVSHAWSWSDERHPGEDNPGGATSA